MANSNEIFNYIADIEAIERQKDQIIAAVEAAGNSIIDFNGIIKGLELKIQSPTGIRDYGVNIQSASSALNGLSIKTQEYNRQAAELQRIQERLKLANSEEAKAIAAATVELREKNKELLREAEASNPVIKARQEQAAADQAAAEMAKAKAIADQEAAEAANQRAMVTAQSLEEMTGANLVLTDAQEKLNAEYERTKAEAATVAQVTRENAAAHQQAAAAAQQEAIALEEESVAQKQSSLSAAANYSLRQQIIIQSIRIKTEMAELTAQMKLNNEAFAAGRIEYDVFEKKTVTLNEQLILLKAQLAQVNSELKIMAPAADKTATSTSKFGSIVERMGLRMIANLVIFQAIIEIIKGLGDQFKKTSDQINYQQVTLSRIAEQSSNNFSQEAINLEILKKRFEDVTASMTTKKEIVQELNEKYSNQIGHINGINDAEAFFRNKSSDMIIALNLRAQAAGAYSVIVENAKKTTELLADPEKSLGGLQKFAAGAKAVLKSATTLNDKNFAEKFNENFDWNKTILGAEQANRDMRDLANSSEFALKRLEDLSKQADAIDAKTGINTNEKGKGKKEKTPKYKDATSAEIKAAKDLADAKLLLDKQEYEQSAAAQKAIYQNEEKSLSERLAAYEEYSNNIKYIAYLETNSAIEQEQQKQKLLEQELEKANSGILKLNAEQTKALETEIQASELRINALRAKGVADANIITSNGEKERRSIIESESKQQADIILGNLNNIAENRASQQNKELQSLLDSYSKGAIATEEYEREKKRIRDKYNNLTIQDTIDYLQESLQLEGFTEQEIQKIREKLTEFRKKKNEEDTKGTEERTKKDQEIDEIYYQTVRHAVQDVANIVEVLNERTSKKRLQDIDNQIDANQQNLEQQLKAVDALNLKEEEKDERKKALQAAAEQRELALNQRKKQEEQTAAQRQKAIAVAAIAIQGALAVVHELTTGDPYTAIARAIAAGALVAAELAVAIATPAYEHGTPPEGHKGGKAKMFEGNKPELVIEPGGKMWVGTKEGIYDLPARSHVKPLRSHVLPMSDRLFTTGQYGQDQKESRLLDLAVQYERSANKIVKAVQGKNLSVNVHVDTRQSQYEYLNARR